MKYFILSLLFLMASCSTRIYSVEKNQTDLTPIQTGKTYWVYNKAKVKTKMVITSTEGDAITGTVGDKTVSFPKSEVSVIKKPKPGATAAIVAGGVVGVAAIILGTIAIINESSSTYYYGY